MFMATQRMGEPDQTGASADRSTSCFNGSWGRIIGQGGDRDPDDGATYGYGDRQAWSGQAGLRLKR
jgi:hypothetical protein